MADQATDTRVLWQEFKRTGDRDHPGSTARAAREDRDRGEADGQNEEEDAKGSPSHLGIMRFA